MNKFVASNFPPIRSAGDDESHQGGISLREALMPEETKLKPPSLYRVILLNDDYTPMEFVVEVLLKFFGMNVLIRSGFRSGGLIVIIRVLNLPNLQRIYGLFLKQVIIGLENNQMRINYLQFLMSQIIRTSRPSMVIPMPIHKNFSQVLLTS